MKISIIIPAYNEEKRIGKTLKEYKEFFQELEKRKVLDFEIIVVLNACRDNTLGVVEKNKFPQLKILDFKQDGKGFAIIEGFKDALKRKNDMIGFVDADMATSPAAYYDLIQNIDNYDGIIGSRWLKDSKVTKRIFLRKITSWGFNFITRSLFLMNYTDTQCGAKLFKKKVVEKIICELNLTRWAFDVNLLYLCKKNKFRIKEHPTTWEDKKDSKLGVFKVSIQMFLGILRLRLINSFFEPILRPIKFILKWGDNLINK